MSAQFVRAAKAFIAICACKWSDSLMDALLMLPQTSRLRVHLVALIACKWFCTSVCYHVTFNEVIIDKISIAYIAHVWTNAIVNILLVVFQVTDSRVRFIAFATRKQFFRCLIFAAMCP